MNRTARSRGKHLAARRQQNTQTKNKEQTWERNVRRNGGEEGKNQKKGKQRLREMNAIARERREHLKPLTSENKTRGEAVVEARRQQTSLQGNGEQYAQRGK
ncbi:hypothetical protein TRVL_09237 [Trypanosoma vivax]|nr:hypothetical protein TRVL_09237 [Trypanosoma vivax]